MQSMKAQQLIKGSFISD